jgi:sulfide:quinone oxidoreductase
MSTSDSPTHKRVVIVGGGVAGLETLLALRALAGDRVELTLVSEHDWFVDRPVTVAEPFGLASAARHSLPDIVAERGARFVGATVVAVHPEAHRVTCADGTELGYDTLVLAPGAQLRASSPDAITFGLEGSGQAIEGMLDRLRSGEARSVAFVAPSTTGWLLPLYELALMTAREVARSNVEGVQLRILSAEDRPLALFGDEGSRSVDRLLAAAGIEFVSPTDVALQSVPADWVVTLPLLGGSELAGVPTTSPERFIPVDEFGRVTGVADVYAAGDAVDFPVKQGGLAAQQADAVAEHIAAAYGANVDPTAFRPVLRGMLFTGEDPLFMRSGATDAGPRIGGAWYPLWWPPTKIAGRYLAPYLFERGEQEELRKPPAGFVDVDIPLAAMTLPG